MNSAPAGFTPKSPLYWLSGVLAVGIFLVGLFAMLAPATGSIMFGMPAATDDALPWIRLAGVRDIALGLVLFATIALREGRTTGLLILLIIVVPIADMTTVFLRTGFSAHVLIHGGAIVYMAGLGTLLLRRR